MDEPVKFEAGMVVRFDGLHIPSGNELVVRGVEKDDAWCVGAVDRLAVYKLQLSGWGPLAVLLSPAPRAGDTWTNGESFARVEAHGAQLRIVSEREPFVGDVVAVARKLWEGGYRMVDKGYKYTFSERKSLDALTERVILDDLKACGLSFDELLARDPVAQALIEQASRGAMRCAASAVPDRVTLDNMKEFAAPAHVRVSVDAKDPTRVHVEASLPAFDGTWPVFTSSAEVDSRVHPTRERPDWLEGVAMFGGERRVDAEGAYSREYHGEFRAPLPRASDIYEHTDGTIVEVREREWRPGLRTHVLRAAVACPMLIEADTPEILAALLREHGYTRRDGGKPAYARRDESRRRMERDKVEAIVKATVAYGASVSEVADAVQRVSKGGISQIAREQAQKWIDRGSLTPQHFDCRVRCTDLLSPARSEPNVAPTDRATSRRHVDAAVARLRGEPFASAIQAALVGVSERSNLTPAEVAAAIAALRHWEARRPFGVALRAEAHASLSRSSADALRGALGYAPVWDTDLLFSTYERARSSR